MDATITSGLGMEMKEPEERGERLASVCFFLNTGRTFTFRNVTIVHDNETAITIEYRAMSDDKPKVATFYKNHVVGVAKLRR